MTRLELLAALAPTHVLDALAQRRPLVVVGHGRYDGNLLGGYRRLDGTWDTETSSAYLLAYDGWRAVANAFARSEESVFLVTPEGSASLLYSSGRIEPLGTVARERFGSLAELLADSDALSLAGWTAIPEGEGFVRLHTLGV